MKVKKISPSDSTDMQNEHIEISLVGLDIKKKLHRAFYDEHDSEYDQVVRVSRYVAINNNQRKSCNT